MTRYTPDTPIGPTLYKLQQLRIFCSPALLYLNIWKWDQIFSRYWNIVEYLWDVVHNSYTSQTTTASEMGLYDWWKKIFLTNDMKKR
jgi:hypothetical protein